MIFTRILLGARAVISFSIRSEMPGYIVLPPAWSGSDKYKSDILRIDISTNQDDVPV
jgi:hypothetical protein